MMRAHRLLTAGLVTLGVFAAGLVCSSAPALAAATGLGPLSTFEGASTPAGSFVPRGIAVDNSAGAYTGDVWVVDTSPNNVVDRFSATGAYQAQIADGFSSPTGVAVDSAGNVYVVDTGNNVVKEFDPATSLTQPVHEFGTGALSGPTGVAVGSSGNVYVADTGENVVKEFEPSTSLTDPVLTFEGSGVGKLKAPTGVAVDSAGNVYIIDAASNVHEFNRLGVAQASLPNLTGYQPEAVGAGPAGALYVVYHDGEIMQYDSAGQVLSESYAGSIQPCTEYFCELFAGEDGTEAGLWGVAAGSAGEVYVANAWEFSETGFGPNMVHQVVVFQPVTLPESLTGTPALDVTATTATLSGEVNPDATELTGCEFQYGLETSYGQSTPCTQELTSLTGNAFKPVEAHLEGLEPHATYHYQLIVRNSDGLARGGEQTLTTEGEAPTVSEESASVTLFGATLDAQVNPNNQDTTCEFQYIDNEAYEAALAVSAPDPYAGAGEAVCSPATLTGFGAQGVSVEVKGLPLDTLYHYQVLVTNATGAIEGAKVPGVEDHTFTTLPPPPVVSTGAAVTVLQTNAYVTGTVNPEGLATTYEYQYGTSTSYEQSSPLLEAGSGSEAVAAPGSLTDLAPDTVYHYRLVATSDDGTNYGEDQTLTTPPGMPPTVSTGPASGVSQNSATISGTVGTNSLQTEYGFEISTEPGNYGGGWGPPTGLGSLGGSATQTVSLTLSKLQPDTSYYYRVTATNADGSSQGAPQSFTTPGFPTLLTPQTSPPLVATPAIAFPTETGSTTATTSTGKPLTKAQKLAKALKACKKDKKNKRTACEKQARKRFAPVKEKKHKQ
jgi:sugar lactone lactonase YvrE